MSFRFSVILKKATKKAKDQFRDELLNAGYGCREELWFIDERAIKGNPKERMLLLNPQHVNNIEFTINDIPNYLDTLRNISVVVSAERIELHKPYFIYKLAEQMEEINKSLDALSITSEHDYILGTYNPEALRALEDLQIAYGRFWETHLRYLV